MLGYYPLGSAPLGDDGQLSGVITLGSETNTALALSRIGIRTFTLASDVNAALALSGLLIRTITPGAQTELSLALGQAMGGLAATETDEALALQGQLVGAVGVAAEFSEAFGLAALAMRQGPVFKARIRPRTFVARTRQTPLAFRARPRQRQLSAEIRNRYFEAVA